jgi:hypothetical protein
VLALSVVKDLDVVEQCFSRSISTAEAALDRELSLDYAEEALADGIVPAVACAAHALTDALN